MGDVDELTLETGKMLGEGASASVWGQRDEGYDYHVSGLRHQARLEPHLRLPSNIYIIYSPQL